MAFCKERQLARCFFFTNNKESFSKKQGLDTSINSLFPAINLYVSKSFKQILLPTKFYQIYVKVSFLVSQKYFGSGYTKSMRSQLWPCDDKNTCVLPVIKVSEWVIKFNSPFQTSDIEVHVIHGSHMITTSHQRANPFCCCDWNILGALG